MVAAVTNIPGYNDLPQSVEHYSKTHVNYGVYGLNKLYKDTHRANEDISIRIMF